MTGNTSPIINVVLNGQLVTADVDTGSEYTLMGESTAKGVGEVNHRRSGPRLRVLTNTPIRTLGTVWAEFRVGETKIHKQWWSVVPDSYMTSDILLGCDVLDQAPFTYNKQKKTLVWADCTYVVSYVRSVREQVSRVRTCPTEPFSPVQSIPHVNLISSVKLGAHQTRFLDVSIKEAPGTTLIIYPQPLTSHNGHPCLVQVNWENTIHIPITNPSKKMILKRGTCLGSYEKVEQPPSRAIRAVREIHNDLLPHHDSVVQQGTRAQRLDEIIDQLNVEHLSRRERQELCNVIRRHDALYILDKHELGLISGDPVNIKVKDPQSSRSPMYRYPEQAKEIIAEMLLDMEEREIIERSTAAWSSSIFLVNKPDGSKRMCLDYRHANKNLAADVHPLPRLDELIEQTAGHQYYVTLDMKDAYFQILLDEESRDLTTFSDGVSLYRFRRLPFGLNCSPAIFSRKMASLLNPLLKEGWVRNYLDDVILMTHDFNTLLERLEWLLAFLAQNGIKLNLGKCSFALKEVTFLGHRISAEGSRPDPKNLESIVTMKAPTSVKEVRSF